MSRQERRDTGGERPGEEVMDRMLSSINRTQQAAGWTPIRGPDRVTESADLGPADRKLYINQSGQRRGTEEGAEQQESKVFLAQTMTPEPTNQRAGNMLSQQRHNPVACVCECVCEMFEL